MPKWTPRQQAAITARNREILVSAAAGSGKTAVLIERVMDLLREGHHLDRMLVMTFTRAAAEEMRERLTRMLGQEAEGNEHLRAQYALLGRADISTLHSFCGKLIRQYFQAVDTDPLAGTADEAIAQELFERALDMAIDAYHDAPDADGESLQARFKEEQIKDMVRSLHAFLMAKDAPFAWLDAALAALLIDSLYEHPWYAILAREASLCLEGAEELLNEALAVCLQLRGPARYAEATQSDLLMVRMLMQELGKQQRFQFAKPSFARLPSKKAPPEEDPELALLVRKNLRDQAKVLITEGLALLPQDLAQADAWLAQLQATLPQLRALAALTRATYEGYQALKSARALVDFGDMEHLALRALADPQVYAEVGAAYDFLFVDEYQDISQIQEAIIHRLHSGDNSLFMVGDVKQSIYRFRLADPSLFLRKQGEFSREVDAPSRLITLRENFRSRPNILEAVNLVFERAMRADATEIDYDAEARLVPGIPQEHGLPVELYLLDKSAEPDVADNLEELDIDEPAFDGDAEEDDEALRPSAQEMARERAFVYEARLIARRVAELVAGRVDEGGGSRQAQYRDIAILLRTAAGRAQVLVEALSAQGIPAYSDTQGEFYTQSDVRDALSLLQVLDNPYQDIPLASALACPAFGLGTEELVHIAIYAQEHGLPYHQAFAALAQDEEPYASAQAQLHRWRRMAQAMPLERFITRLLQESGLYAIAGAKEEGALRRANLRLLAARAAPLPEPQNLADFVARALAAREGRSPLRAASLGMQENVVRVMTLHKSKGLQFPIVILPDLAASFARKQRPTPLRMDAQTGLALLQIDPVLRIKNEGFGLRALKAKKKREELSEEARLLYVGMTRAQERLILIGTPENLDSAVKRWARPSGRYTASSASCMLDWVCQPLFPAISAGLPGIYEAPGGSRWLIETLPTHSLREQAEETSQAALAPVMPPDTQVKDALFAPLTMGRPLPQKSSVTALVFQAEAQADEEETPQVKRRPWQAPELAPLPGQVESSGLTAAQRGAAAHKALCALNPADFTHLPAQDLRPALSFALDGLAARGLLMAQERHSIDLVSIERFYQSDLARRMSASAERHAEWPFTLLVEEQVILQGVLDSCFLEDGSWVLVDYKTDWGEPEELRSRYSAQMRWYMRALRDITGQSVKEAWLYLLRRGEALQVEEAEGIHL